MKLLAIDTATDACSVAMDIDGELFSDHRVEPQQHAALLLPMVDGLCTKANIELSMLDAVVFGQGPGSFTGLRIAASTAAGIAFGADCKIIALSSLQAMAQGVYRMQGVKKVFVATDARMGEMYWGTYRLDDAGLMQAASEDALNKPELVEIPVGFTPAGSGVEVYKNSPNTVKDVWPNAIDLISLAKPLATAKQWESADSALPIYLRDRVALTEAQRAAGERLN